MAVPSRSSPTPTKRIRARNFILLCPRPPFARNERDSTSRPWPLLPGGWRAAKSPGFRTSFREAGAAILAPERTIPPGAPVAQLDRALDYESRGREFESLRARHLINHLARSAQGAVSQKSLLGRAWEATAGFFRRCARA